MRIIMAVLLALVLAAPVAAGERPHKLTFESGCLQPNGTFGVLVIGKGTVNQPIDWSPDKRFSVLGNAGVSNLLEGESGALGFWITLPPPEYGVTIAYTDGVWVRWSLYPKVVTHIPVPQPCGV